MKLTKLQRYTLYCILQYEFELFPQGICLIWYDLTEELIWMGGYSKKFFPELYKRRKINSDDEFESWFKTDKQRSKALQECIEETHP